VILKAQNPHPLMQDRKFVLLPPRLKLGLETSCFKKEHFRVIGDFFRSSEV
jgi:hypothetical protein